MKRLKEVRAERLMTVRGLADLAGIAPSTVHLVETGQSRPQFRVIERLSLALDVEPEHVTEFREVIEDVGGA